MRHRTRLLSVAALIALTSAVLAAPVSAGGSIRYVDDDGTAAAAGCDGAVAVPTSIQAAVDASGPGDTILVCPGTYPEQVAISGAAHKGLTIRSTQKWAARIAPTALDGAEDADAIVRVASPRVTLLWLKVIARTSGACEQAEHAVEVSSARGAVIRGLRIVASTKASTLWHGCGYRHGITVRQSADALVRHNKVRDFQVVGVWAVGSQDVAIRDTSIQFWHQPTCVAASRTACVRRQASPSGFDRAAGIRVEGSSGVVQGNAITRGPEDGAIGGGALTAAMDLQDAEGLQVIGNKALRVNQGLIARNVSNTTIRDNLLVGINPPVSASVPAAPPLDGIDVGNSTGVRVRDNRVAWFMNGLYVYATTGSVFRGNDATDNRFLDCVESTPMAGGVPANTWTDNLGNQDSPTGLCTDAPVTPLP